MTNSCHINGSYIWSENIMINKELVKVLKLLIEKNFF